MSVISERFTETIEKRFDPSEKRDKDGKWTHLGGLTNQELLDRQNRLKTLAKPNPALWGGAIEENGAINTELARREQRSQDWHNKPRDLAERAKFHTEDASSMTDADRIRHFQEMHGRLPSEAEMKRAKTANRLTGKNAKGEASQSDVNTAKAELDRLNREWQAIPMGDSRRKAYLLKIAAAKNKLKELGTGRVQKSIIAPLLKTFTTADMGGAGEAPLSEEQEKSATCIECGMPDGKHRKNCPIGTKLRSIPAA